MARTFAPFNQQCNRKKEQTMKRTLIHPIGRAVLAGAAPALLTALVILVTIAPRPSAASMFTSPLPTPPPQTREVSLPDTTGETAKWSIFTSTGFIVRHPSDWQARTLPDQIAGTQIIEFAHIAPSGRVDAAIQVWETWLSSDSDWEQEPELRFWREQNAKQDRLTERALVGGQPGYLMQTKRIAPGDLSQAVFVMQKGRLYRFRLYLYQTKVIEPHLRTFGLMIGTLQTRDASRPASLAPSATMPEMPLAAQASLAAITNYNYNRGAAYAYAATWWQEQNNSDGCYLWDSESVLDCIYHSGDRGVDGAHFVNRAVWTGGRPIPQLIPERPYDVLEAIRVSSLRAWLINDGWTTVSASQAQIGDVVIIGSQCWAGLVVEPGNPPKVATHSIEYWGSAEPLQCNGNSSKEYLHAPQGGFFTYLPVVLKNYPIQIKAKSGIHLGSRATDPNHTGWTEAMLQPIDGDRGGVWPTSIVILSDQVYNLGRPFDPTVDNPYCRIAFVDLQAKSGVVYDYMKRASASGVKVLIRINPSPGNFQDWNDPLQQNHHLLSSGGPAGGGYCYNNGHQNQVRHIGDLVQEIAQIHEYNVRHGLWEYAFVPANEPNLEWYTTTPTITTFPTIRDPIAWQEMDAYFSKLYQQVHAITPPPDLVDKWGTIRLLTPPMAQERFAEGVDILGDPNQPGGCDRASSQVRLKDGNSGYGTMTTTYQTANDGIAWHNYWRYGKEWSGGCNSYGDHLSSMVDPYWLRYEMRDNTRGNQNFIIEADLASPWQMRGSSSLTNKNANSGATAQSLRVFFYSEPDALVNAWLLSYEDTPGVFNAEIHWHEAYSDTVGMLPWFLAWWNGSE